MTPAQIILEKIQTLEAKYKGLEEKSFDDLSFEEKMMFFKLKGDLGLLYLAATQHAQTPAETGQHLRNIVKHNPFLRPNLVGERSLGAPFPSTNESDTGVAARRLATVPPTVVVAIPVGFVLAFVGTPLNYLYTYAIERTAQAAYVKLFCLEDIDATITSATCLSTAVFFLDAGDNYKAIRYLLEAEKRSSERNLEIAHYLFLAIQNVGASTNEKETVRGVYKLDGLPNEELLWPRLYAMKTKVLNGSIVTNSQLQFIWDLENPDSILPSRKLSKLQNLSCAIVGLRNNDFQSLVSGNLTSDKESYQVTLAELSQHFRQALYTTYPEMKSKYCLKADILPNPTQSNNALKNVSLTQLAAYMSQVYVISTNCLNAGITSHILLASPTKNDDLAEEHLNQLLDQNKLLKDNPTHTQQTALTYYASSSNNNANNANNAQAQAKINPNS